MFPCSVAVSAVSVGKPQRLQPATRIAPPMHSAWCASVSNTRPEVWIWGDAKEACSRCRVTFGSVEGLRVEGWGEGGWGRAPGAVATSEASGLDPSEYRTLTLPLPFRFRLAFAVLRPRPPALSPPPPLAEASRC